MNFRIKDGVSVQFNEDFQTQITFKNILHLPSCKCIN